MKRNPLNLTIGILLVLIVALLLFVFQVRTSEVVVVTTFGKPTRDVTEPGPHLRWPYPIESIHRLDQRVQNFEDLLTESQTKEAFNLLSSVYVGWRITNPTNFLPKFAGGPEPITEAERVLKGMLNHAKVAVIGTHPLRELLAPSGEGNKFTEIEGEILKNVQAQIPASYGLEVVFLGIKRLDLPERVTQSVFERMQSERKVLAESSQSEGEAQAEKIRSEARRRAAEMLATAQGQAIEIRGQGEAKAAQSLTVFQQNPELATFLFRLNALESALKDRSTLIFDRTTPPFDVLQGVSTNLLNLK